MRWSVKQFVTFQSRGKEMRGKIMEITMFRRESRPYTNVIKYGLMVYVRGKAPMWIGDEQVVARSSSGRKPDSHSGNGGSIPPRAAKREDPGWTPPRQPGDRTIVSDT